ncbi:hypothetical protein [Saliterribacillus persicus]|uniref:Uncharacterized protein n=1 Tax=Saliterribacillus persicus TaxID=930114 RepID=A0A368XEN6_9BACI|nr:hypothetical protein [Saliterribacillus persicus]RCW66423.1 hypothetical protein DFR57_109146 [Saliterribacillus persicus]
MMIQKEWALKEQPNELKESADWLKNIESTDQEYYVIYQKQEGKDREFKFNKVKELDNETFKFSYHLENELEGVRYYSGEDIVLDNEDIIHVFKIDPKDYDFLVFTD